MKRRVLALLAALALMIALPAFALAADNELAVRAPEKAPTVGESFTVTVEVRGNPEANGIRLALRYDKEALRCTEIEEGEAIDGMLNVVNERASSGAMIAAASAEPVVLSGTIAVFHFKVLQEGAAIPREMAVTEINTLGGDTLPVTIRQLNENGEEVDMAQTPDPDPTTGTPDPDPTTGTTDPGTTAETPDPDPTAETPDPATTEDPAGGGAETPEQTETAAPSFPDIEGHWGAQYIRKAAEMELFTGFPDGSFRPNGEVTRAQYVTVLWRMAGTPEPAEPAPFDDVPAGLWYSDAVAWAYGQGYVSGRSETVFDPNGSITRQEAMKILFAYSGGVSGMEVMLTGVYDADFTDSGAIAPWAKPAMYWGYYKGIINGKSAATLCPTDTATRAELAKILVIYAEKAADGTI